MDKKQQILNLISEFIKEKRENGMLEKIGYNILDHFMMIKNL